MNKYRYLFALLSNNLIVFAAFFLLGTNSAWATTQCPGDYAPQLADINPNYCPLPGYSYSISGKCVRGKKWKECPSGTSPLGLTCAQNCPVSIPNIGNACNNNKEDPKWYWLGGKGQCEREQGSCRSCSLGWAKSPPAGWRTAGGGCLLARNCPDYFTMDIFGNCIRPTTPKVDRQSPDYDEQDPICDPKTTAYGNKCVYPCKDSIKTEDGKGNCCKVN